MKGLKLSDWPKILYIGQSYLDLSIPPGPIDHHGPKWALQTWTEPRQGKEGPKNLKKPLELLKSYDFIHVGPPKNVSFPPPKRKINKIKVTTTHTPRHVFLFRPCLQRVPH